MRRLAAPALLLLLPACSGTSGQAPTGRSLPTALAPTDARVDSLLCDDLRAIVEVRRGAPAVPSEVVDTAAQAAVAAAARRVLVSAEPSGVLPEEVAQALREYEARDAEDPARDAVVVGYAEEQCPG